MLTCALRRGRPAKKRKTDDSDEESEPSDSEAEDDDREKPPTSPAKEADESDEESEAEVDGEKKERPTRTRVRHVSAVWLLYGILTWHSRRKQRSKLHEPRSDKPKQRHQTADLFFAPFSSFRLLLSLVPSIYVMNRSSDDICCIIAIFLARCVRCIALIFLGTCQNV